MSKKVFVGLSGGVDSAVSAYLLLKEGYDVTGVFIRGWEPDFLPCTGKEDRLSAMRVAAHLKIPFKTYDFSEEYQKRVVEPFVAEYAAGRTPNPDVLCNRNIKFDAFWKRAQSEGADYIATGHYAHTDGTVMSISKDPSKDQTYFLWTLTKDDLSHTLFPLGNIKKADTRSLARTAKLPNAERPDSQGLCFLGHVDMHSFLMRYIPARSGEIQSTDGIVLGMHDGVEFYTLGQRVATNAPEPHYVVGKDRASNVLTVSSRAEGVQPHTTYSLTEVNSNEQGAFKCNAAYRYHGELVRARVEGSTITFAKPVQVATGQSVVFYSDVGTVLGGGIIDACLK